MTRHQLLDEHWEMIAEVFPPPARTGRPPNDRRAVAEGIVWILRTGSPWRDLPEEFGPWETVYGCFNRWNAAGVIDAMLHLLRAARVDLGALDAELWCVDGTVVRAHRCAAGGGKKTTQASQPIMR